MAECDRCVDNSAREGQPEFGKGWKRANNAGCQCSCGSGDSGQTVQPGEGGGPETVRRSARRERPTDDPSVWVVVN